MASVGFIYKGCQKLPSSPYEIVSFQSTFHLVQYSCFIKLGSIRVRNQVVASAAPIFIPERRPRRVQCNVRTDTRWVSTIHFKKLNDKFGGEIIYMLFNRLVE